VTVSAHIGRVTVPTISLNHDYLLLVVAVLGTTISPYLFFWQASQEAAGANERPVRWSSGRFSC
jgi:Mn2+/Fe2+ NRAMP family transporter